jgi:hypothetical protein
MDNRPMLNTPAETNSRSAEDFKNNLLARMDGAHDANHEIDTILSKLRNESAKSIEEHRREFAEELSALTGLTFDPETGRCTSTAKVDRDYWAKFCQKFSSMTDATPEQVRELWRELGKVVRGEAESG